MWIRNWSRTEYPRIRLLCFPCAGGGIHVYRRWARRMPPDVGVCAVELPGHDSRLAEPPQTDLGSLLTGPLRPAVEALLDRPMAVFGHSMGAVLAADLCSEIGRDRGWHPALFVAAGAETPDQMRVPYGPDSTDQQILRYLDIMGGSAPQLLADDEYRQLLISAVRADLTLIATRRPAPPSPLGCPLRVYAGEQDRSLSHGQAMAWKQLGTGDFAVRSFPGGHFFPSTAADLVLEALVTDIGAAMDTARPGPS